MSPIFVTQRMAPLALVRFVLTMQFRLFWLEALWRPQILGNIGFPLHRLPRSKPKMQRLATACMAWCPLWVHQGRYAFLEVDLAPAAAEAASVASSPLNLYIAFNSTPVLSSNRAGVFTWSARLHCLATSQRRETSSNISFLANF